MRQANILSDEQKEKRRTYARERARRLRLDPAYRAQELERNEQWRKRHPEQLKVIRAIGHRRWYVANRDQKLAQNKRWKEEHPEAVRAYQAKRVQISSIIKMADRLSRDYAAILYADPCVYCGAPATTVDHIEPSDSGGENHWTNFTAACGSCNSSKSTSPLLEFLWRA